MASEVDKLLLKHNNRPMKALYEALEDKANQGIELPMSIIMDPLCGIGRRAEGADVPRYLVGVTPLLMAIYTERLDVAKALLAAGVDPNAKASGGDNSFQAPSNGFNALILAARLSNSEAIESLVSYGADINAVDKEGRTALHHATSLGHASIMELLERAGPNLEAVNNKGCTPLHNAGDVGPIKALFELGANQAAVDNEGRTPLHRAAASLFVSVDAIEAFRCNVAAFEANLTAVDKNGHTPLQVYESSSTANDDDIKIRALLAPK